MMRRTHLLALIASLGIQVACAATRFPAAGVVFGERIDTTMDSPAAAYYLGSHFGGTRNNPALDEKIDRLHAMAPADRLPNRDELLAVAGEFSTDFAALFFADRVSRQIENARVHAMFADYLHAPKDGADLLAPSYGRYVILFAPGWDYISNGSVTGADFAEPRRLISALGIENHLIELAPNGSVEANAGQIVQTLDRALAGDKRVIVVSASSAGPAVHLALDAIKAAGARAPAAWLNLGGILQGSPLVEHVGQFPLSVYRRVYTWIKGWNESAIESMSAARCRARFPQLTVPRDTLVLNYVGLSLSGSLSRFAKGNYAVLQKEGPNDGLTPLADVVAPRSLTLVAPRSDHFFAEDPLINAKTVALAKTIISLLDRPDLASH